MEPRTNFPLPPEQYRWYVLFWHALMLGALMIALGIILWQNWEALSWREVVGVILVLTQMILYLRLLVFPRGWPLPRLDLYFTSGVALWLFELWIVPEIWWTIFPYIGQMFGLLPAKHAIIATLFISIFLFGRSINWHLSVTDPKVLLGTLAQGLSAIGFYIFVNHLIRTSQDRGQLIKELEATKQELELAQQREAELAVLRERERLARDLHDSLGHTLVALSVQLEAVQRLYRVDPERASAQVDEMKALTRTSMDSLRRSLAGLRAPGLGGSALRPALEAICEDFGQRTGTVVTYQVGAVADELSPSLSEALWRVAQEALTNVEKHAQARTVSLVLEKRARDVVLLVTDDGIGLPAGAESSPNRFGLRGIRERVEGVGGTVAFQGRDGGTRVEVHIPLITTSS